MLQHLTYELMVEDVPQITRKVCIYAILHVIYDLWLNYKKEVIWNSGVGIENKRPNVNSIYHVFKDSLFNVNHSSGITELQYLL